MTERERLAIGSGTAIAAVGFWIGLFVLGRSVPLGVGILAVGAVMSLLAVAGFSREADQLRIGIRSASVGMSVGALLFLVAGITGSLTMTLLVPAAILGAGGIAALPGGNDPQRTSMRMILSGIAAAIVVFLGLLSAELWGLFAPLVPLPTLALADRIWARSADDHA
ncbi:MAG: hypothetical protein BMS9Abin07_1915 [Acidimicrobiia bacterium]|nr:MAG: hypothetical protein BMS9Abin07_1915 [Acidimicrobiia bacterium]